MAHWPAADAPWAQAMAALLLAQDGSATRLCETAAGGPVDLVVHHQARVACVPPVVAAELPATVWLERVVSLQAHGQVMMDNLSWIALDRLPDDVQQDLLACRLPIGHLLARLWTRRVPVAGAADVAALAAHLWPHVGLPDLAATRSYGVHLHSGAVMLITECFRRGVLMHPQASG